MSTPTNAEDQHDSKRQKTSPVNDSFDHLITMAANISPNFLRAVYSAPQSAQTFEHSISSPAPPAGSSPEDNDINIFLTKKMEEDKTLAEAQGRQISEQERKEEENYGEEVVEEDD